MENFNTEHFVKKIVSSDLFFSLQSYMDMIRFPVKKENV